MGLTTHHQQEEEMASSLCCEIKIIQAKNLDFLSSAANIFVRCYLMADKGKKIQLNSREIKLCNSNDPCWNEYFSLECRSPHGEAAEELQRQKVVFELRWRSYSTNLFSKVVGSKLLGKVEIAWRDVLEEEGMQIERWFPLVAAGGRLPAGEKPLAMQLALRVSNTKKDDQKADCRRKLPPKNWEECGCVHGSCSASDDELLAIAAVLDFL